MRTVWPQEVLAHSRAFVNAPLPYAWSGLERRALELFFSNTNSRVFFMQNLPPHVNATIFSMYSRLKNPRGIRGIFVDQFLPQLLASELAEVRHEFGGNEEAFLRARRIRSLDAFADYSQEAQDVTNMFLDGMRQDPRSLALLRQSEKAKRFLATWLDAYGHNSIARMATMWLGFEQISVLAVKSLAWARPGAAQIGLSFRYTDASGKDCYPIAEELAMLGADAGRVRGMLELAFRLYRELLGSFPQFLRERWGSHPYFAEHPEELETGILGETYDVLGNLLPAATLQSVGFSVSGEALPSVLKHLLLDSTPENLSLVEAILTEAEKTGAIQFCRHYEPSEWERETWRYLEVESFRQLIGAYPPPCAVLCGDIAEPYTYSERNLAALADAIARDEHDKLPREFETVTLPFVGVMSFRGWRDLQRQSLSTHLRTYLTTKLGFYRYDKPAPEDLHRAFDLLAVENRAREEELSAAGIPIELRQYVLALGNNVGFLMSSNLRQWEFCNWQRTKWSVNHEVRQVFRAIEQALRQRYPWWERVSRADVTPAYVFARGKKAVALAP
jgi:thymidylate synthase ThyX